MSNTTDTTYNGWKNHETWCVNLWLSNEQFHSEIVHALIGDAASSELSLWKAAENIKDYVEELIDDILSRADAQASMFADLVGGAISSVDFEEIVRNWAEEMDIYIGEDFRLYEREEVEA